MSKHLPSRICGPAARLVFGCWLAAVASPAVEGTRAPELERAAVVGSGLRVGLTNRAPGPSSPVELVVTTRSGGRLVGSARHTVDPLEPGDVIEAWVPLAIWGAGRPELRAVLIDEGCCTTRLWLEPGGSPLEIRHTLAPGPVGSGAPEP